MERRLIDEYRELIEQQVDRLTESNLRAGVTLAAAARDIAGFGPVKEAAAARYYEELESLTAAMHDSVDVPRELPLVQVQ